MSQSSIQPAGPSRSLVAQVIVFLLSIGLTVGLYAGLHRHVPPDDLLVRYLAGHWVEYVETGLFIWAMLALAAKLGGILRQRMALRNARLPGTAQGQLAPAAAGELLAKIDDSPRFRRQSMAMQRLRAGLDFVHQRGSAEGLDDYLRAQSDADANAVEGSYGLIRFITWAIPILGFLGTVLGITDAIANVTPEQLATSITGVTDGLAIAFDTTAVALGYSMCIMFLTFMLDRMEQGVLVVIDNLAERELAHRFERLGGEGNEVVALVRNQGQMLLQTSEQLVQKQAAVWAQSMEALRTRLESAEAERQRQLALALGAILEKTLAVHEQRLNALEQRWLEQAGAVLRQFDQLKLALEQTNQALNGQQRAIREQAELMRPILETEQHLLKLQDVMTQNLAAVAGAGAFQEAVHSLTAAIHLLTARAESVAAAAKSSGPLNRPRQGHAA